MKPLALAIGILGVIAWLLLVRRPVRDAERTISAGGFQ